MMTAPHYNLKNIRTLLIEGFTDGELRRFCHDDPIFRPVYNELAQNSGKAQIVDQLLDYANRTLKVEFLLAWVKEQNLAMYERYQPYITTPSEVSDNTPEDSQNTETYSRKTNLEWDVFISHASQDKPFVSELASALNQRGLRVWYDNFTLRVGDNLTRSVDQGLTNCKYGIVILSPNFFAKEWPQRELDALAIRERTGEKVILPVWHNITETQLRKYSLDLANRIAVSSSLGLEHVVTELLRAMELEHLESDIELVQKKRRIDAVAPSHAEVGQHIDLLVQVRFPSSPLLGIKDWPTKQQSPSIEQVSGPMILEFPVDPRTGELGSARLEIRVVAPDFKIEGTAQQFVEVPPNQYSKRISFFLTAMKAGSCRINVEIYTVDCTYLGTIPIETTIGRIDTLRTAKVANLFLIVVVRQEEPENPSIYNTTKTIPNQSVKGFLSDPVWQGVAGVIAIITLGLAFYSSYYNHGNGTESTTPSPSNTKIAVALIETITPTSTSTPKPPTETPLPSPTPIPTDTPVISTATPSPTPTNIPTPIPTIPTSTSTPAQTATPTPTIIPSSLVTPTLAIVDTTPTVTISSTTVLTSYAPTGQIVLLKPKIGEVYSNQVVFEWQWQGPTLPNDQGFEVRVWREGASHSGVHSAVEDNLTGKVETLSDNIFRLAIGDIKSSVGVNGGSGLYQWTVAVVLVKPKYEDLGNEATPSFLCVESCGKSGGGSSGGTGYD